MMSVRCRAVRAERHAKNVLTRYNKMQERIVLKDGLRQDSHRRRVLTKEARTARQEAKEDHMLGPLAPCRANSKKEAEEYGAVTFERLQTPYLPVDKRIKYWNIVVGDRVVVLKGPDRHKIGVVKRVEKKGNALVVGGLNMVPLKCSEEADVTYSELPVDYDDVRLVYPLPDPETGIPTDTIIAKIKRSKVWTDKRTKAKTWDRLIPGMEGVKIPWPAKKAFEHVDHLADTRILDVETVSFTPTLLDPPMPVGVIDELRNKYSKFRIRHDVEYIAKKEAQELDRRKLVEARIVTPIQELNKKLREERKALGKQVLSDVVLEKIGRVMAQNRPELLAGTQAVPAGEEAVV